MNKAKDPNYDHGLIVRGRLIAWNGINNQFVCRLCSSSLSGRPYADPITGELDHDLYVCDGTAEHEIYEEGDIMHQKLLSWVEQKQFYDRYQVLKPFVQGSQRAKSKLYEDADFEGFD